MLHSYSVNPFTNNVRENSVDDKLHCRGDLPNAFAQTSYIASTQTKNKRRYGFINEILRKMFMMLLVLSSSLALAHEGFNVVLKDVAVNPYTVTVLEDTHIAENQTQMNLMIQVAHGRNAAPADTKVFLTLGQDQKLIYDSEVKYVGSSSSDGRTFYAYYIITVPLPQQGVHQARLELDSSLGKAATNFQFEAKAVPDFRAAELIPSLLIISICLAGLALFVISTRTPQQNPLPQQDQKGLHHA